MIKIKALLGDCLRSLGAVKNQHSVTLELPSPVVFPNIKLETLEVQMEKPDFTKWIRTFHRRTLFLEGDSKGNRRVARGGEILLDLKF